MCNWKLLSCTSFLFFESLKSCSNYSSEILHHESKEKKFASAKFLLTGWHTCIITILHTTTLITATEHHKKEQRLPSELFQEILKYTIKWFVFQIILSNMWKLLTQIHGCFSASEAVIRFAGLMVSILLIRSFASGVTVSHSGEGNLKKKKSMCVLSCMTTT